MKITLLIHTIKKGLLLIIWALIAMTSYAQHSDGIVWAGSCPGITANDKIEEAIRRAVALPGHHMVGLNAQGPGPNGQWVIDRSIKLPSHTTLILAGAHLMAKTGAKTLLLENDDPTQGNTDIHILGWGGAKIDGNAMRQPERSGGSVHFYKVDGLTFKGVQVGRTNGWALKLEHVSNVQIDGLHFFQGNEHPWQDGIHVVGPAHTVTISNITGTFGDDAIVVDSAMGGKGPGGAVTGVTVTNVVATNIWGAGLLRTIAAKGKPVSGVYCSNMTFFTKNGGTDAAIKIGWDGKLEKFKDWQQPDAEEHRNIVIENLNIPHWEGPILTVQNNVKNLTLRNITATHKGPFFYNLEHDVDGLLIDNCHSTLIGNPPNTLVTEFYSALVAKKIYTLSKPYQGDFIKDPPGIIAFDHAHIRDVAITHSRFDFRGEVNDKTYPIALRVYNTANIDGLYLNNVKINGYRTGIKIDQGGQVKDFDYQRIRQEGVAQPFDMEMGLANKTNNRN